MVAKWPVPWCIGGDLNVVRFTSERLGGSRSVRDDILWSLRTTGARQLQESGHHQGLTPARPYPNKAKQRGERRAGFLPPANLGCRGTYCFATFGPGPFAYMPASVNLATHSALVLRTSIHRTSLPIVSLPHAALVPIIVV